MKDLISQFFLPSNIYQTISFIALPANVMRRHGCSAEALHAVVVDKARLSKGCQGLIDLCICS